jgi:hypothetical protein
VGKIGSRGPLGPPHLLMEREIVVGRRRLGVTSESLTVTYRYDTRWNVNALFDTIWSLGQGPWLTSEMLTPLPRAVTDPG